MAHKTKCSDNDHILKSIGVLIKKMIQKRKQMSKAYFTPTAYTNNLNRDIIQMTSLKLLNYSDLNSAFSYDCLSHYIFIKDFIMEALI